MNREKVLAIKALAEFGRTEQDHKYPSSTVTKSMFDVIIGIIKNDSDGLDQWAADVMEIMEQNPDILPDALRAMIGGYPE